MSSVEITHVSSPMLTTIHHQSVSFVMHQWIGYDMYFWAICVQFLFKYNKPNLLWLCLIPWICNIYIDVIGFVTWIFWSWGIYLNVQFILEQIIEVIVGTICCHQKLPRFCWGRRRWQRQNYNVSINSKIFIFREKYLNSLVYCWWLKLWLTPQTMMVLLEPQNL